MEKELQPEESLKIIQEMVKAARQRFADNGLFMIIWGIILILAAIVNYVLLISTLSHEAVNLGIVIVWIGFPVAGGIISFVMGSRQSKKAAVKTQMSDLLKYMWVGFGVALFFVILLPNQKGLSPIPFILILTAFAIYIFGLGIKYIPFLLGSICVMAIGVWSFWVNYPLQLLAFGSSIFLGYLIPGVLLYRQSKASK